MKLEVKANCPLDGFNPCRQMNCAWFTQVRGVNPNTGQEVEEWGCAMAWLPIMLMENSHQQKITGAAVDHMRNEIVNRMDGPTEIPPHQALPPGYGVPPNTIPYKG